MNNKLLNLKWIFLILCFSFSVKAQNVKKIYLNPVEKSLSDIMAFGTPQIKAIDFKIYQIDINSLKNQMNGVGYIDDNTSGFVAAIQIPLADGSMHEFLSKENNTMARELAANFPEIKAFDGIGSANGEIANWDITPHGFHAMIYIPGKGTVFIDPIIKGNTEYYIVYKRKDFTTDKVMECGLIDELPSTPSYTVKSGSCELRTYRLALAATGEYTTFHGGTVALAQAAQVTSMNRVNQVYQREMAIRMNIIGNNNLIIYTNAGSDPYTNNNGATMLGQNQTTCDAVIGSANYDIGHVFSTGGGGIAQLQSPCSTGNKARGVTGSPAPVGDPFDIDYVAHEMGHQFGGNHTQNNNCNRNNATAMEPGSASTIMGYAGICAPNVQNNSDDYFHSITLQEIGAFITGGGHTCPVKTPLSNSSPSVTTSSASVSVPISTPFFLTAIGSDPDPGNVLTYTWEQMNNQTSTQPPVATSTGGPNFRSYDPTTNPTRYFPNLNSLSTNGPYTWEVLPSVARTMNFRVSVRDNASGGGCNSQANITVTTVASAGPFNVTYPNNTGITWAGASSQTVTWTVAGTTAAPISCANVDILLSTDGGLTYPTVLASNTPNDGTQTINVPNTPSTTCRIMVVCSNGNFFDISNNNFTITAATSDYTINTAPASISICQGINAVYTVNTGSIGGYSSNINLSVSGVPAGANSNFSVNPVVPGNSSTLTISNTAGVTPGSYNLVITANSASGTKTNNVTLIVSSGAPSAVTLTAPANGATGVSIPTSFSWSTSAGATYQIQISTNVGFTAIVDQATGLATTTYNSSLLSNSTTYYWRVRATTGCGTSAWSSTFSFTTGTCSTTVSPNVPVAITATGTPTVTSTITIPSSITIADINVKNITGVHTYVSDLTVTLSSPSATTVTLWSGICTTLDDFNLNFDDAAAAGAIPCPPTGGGTHQPVNPLSAFNGENAAGVWTLTISDAFDADGGSLNSWSLEICGAACSPPATPTISAGGPTTFCTGGSVTLTSSATTGNQWYNGGTLIAGATGQTYSVTASGNYTVISTVGCPSAASAATSVTVNPTPATPTISAGGPTTFCTGGSVTLTSSSATGNQWSLNGSPIGGATAQTYVASAAGNYTVIVTTSGCPSAASAATSVTVNLTPATPTITAGGAITFCAGGSVTLTSSSSTGNQWYLNGTLIGGATAQTYSATAAGNYTVIVTTSGCPSAASAVRSVTVNPTPATPTITAGGATTFCAGGSVTLTSSSATGNQWYLNGTLIGGATAQTYSATAAGNYTVIVTTSGCPSAASAVRSVTVNPTPATPTITAGGPITFCTGGSVTLTSSSATGNQWSLNGTPIGGATAQTYVANAAGNYTVMVTTAGCPSAASAATTATVNPTPATPTITAGGPITFCTGGSVTLTSSSATSNQWSLNGTPIGGATAQTYFASAAGNYTVVVISGGCTSAASATTTVTVNPTPVITVGTVTNPSACATSTGSIQVNGSATGIVSWTGTVSGSSGSVTLPHTITGLAAGTYNISINNGTCPSNVLVQGLTDPSAPATPTITAGGPITFCAGGSVTLTSISATGNQWSLNGTPIGGATAQTYVASATGNYAVIVVSAGCTSSASNTVSVTVNPTPATPTITAGGTTTFCTGGSVTLTSSSTTGNQWSLNGTPIGGATAQTYAATAAGNYTVMVTGTCPSAASAATTVTVNPTPATPTITAGGPITFCTGGSVTLTSSSATGNLWSLNGTPIGGATAQTYVATAAGNYTVMVTGTCPSASSAATTVTVNPNPVITLGTITNPSACATSTGSIQVNGSTTGIVSWTGTASGSSGSVTLPYTISGLAAGTYNISINNGTCPSNVLVQGLTDPSAPATPTVSTGGATTFCTGGSVTLTSSSATGNQWSLDGTPIGGATAQTYVASATGNYTVVIISGGCTSSASSGITVTVSATSVITVGTVTDPSSCATATGSIQVNGSATGIVSWTGTAAGSSGSVTLPYVITGLAAGSYNIAITTGGCPSNLLVQGLTDPSAPATPTVSNNGSTTFCVGSSVTLTASSATGNQWYLNGSSISGATGQNYLATASGDYSVNTVAGTCTSGISSATTVTVNPNPSAPMVTTSGSTAICTGSSVTLTSSQPNGNVWSNGLTTSSILVNTAGIYTVTYTNGNGCSATTSGVEVTINPSPATPTISASGPLTFCKDGSVDLTSSYTGGNVWSTNAPTDMITILTSGSYTVTYTDVNGCSATSAATTVVVNPLPIVSFAAMGTLCDYNAPLTLTGGVPAGGSYSGTGVSAGSFNPTTAGFGNHTLTYTYTDGNGCTNSANSDVLVDDCAAIDELAENVITLFPNPTFGVVNIVSSVKAIENIRIFDATGRLVNELNGNNANSITINMIEYAQGVYNFEFQIGETIHRERIIRN